MLPLSFHWGKKTSKYNQKDGSKNGIMCLNGGCQSHCLTKMRIKFCEARGKFCTIYQASLIEPMYQTAFYLFKAKQQKEREKKNIQTERPRETHHTLKYSNSKYQHFHTVRFIILRLQHFIILSIYRTMMRPFSHILHIHSNEPSFFAISQTLSFDVEFCFYFSSFLSFFCGNSTVKTMQLFTFLGCTLQSRASQFIH